MTPNLYFGMIRMAADGDRMVEGGNQAGLARAAG